MPCNAQYRLGYMYVTGQRVTTDIVKNKVLWTKAAAQGHEIAIETLKLLLK